MIEFNGGLWVPRSIDEEPEVRLSQWCVFELLMRGRDLRTRHFVGTNINERAGRVSSAIEAFDGTKRRGVTKSGRVYELVGLKNGLNGDALYTWNAWMRYNGAAEIVDVTSEIFESITLGTRDE